MLWPKLLNSPIQSKISSQTPNSSLSLSINILISNKSLVVPVIDDFEISLISKSSYRVINEWLERWKTRWSVHNERLSHLNHIKSVLDNKIENLKNKNLYLSDRNLFLNQKFNLYSSEDQLRLNPLPSKPLHLLYSSLNRAN